MLGCSAQRGSVFSLTKVIRDYNVLMSRRHASLPTRRVRDGMGGEADGERCTKGWNRMRSRLGTELWWRAKGRLMWDGMMVRLETGMESSVLSNVNGKKKTGTGRIRMGRRRNGSGTSMG